MFWVALERATAFVTSSSAPDWVEAEDGSGVAIVVVVAGVLAVAIAELANGVPAAKTLAGVATPAPLCNFVESGAGTPGVVAACCTPPKVATDAAGAVNVDAADAADAANASAAPVGVEAAGVAKASAAAVAAVEAAGAENAPAAAVAAVEAAGAENASAAAPASAPAPASVPAPVPLPAPAALSANAVAADGGAPSCTPGADCAAAAAKKSADGGAGAGALLLGLAGGGASKAVDAEICNLWGLR